MTLRSGSEQILETNHGIVCLRTPNHTSHTYVTWPGGAIYERKQLHRYDLAFRRFQIVTGHRRWRCVRPLPSSLSNRTSHT